MSHTPTALIGRERELAALHELLGGDEVRLVTLTGPGGTGKTRLALQVAADLLEQFPDGVFFVALAPLTDPGLVISTIGQTLEIRETGGQPLLDTLKGFLRDKTLLLVLDNFEQLLHAVPVLADLLTAAPKLKLLVTSRAQLHLRGEKAFPVLPLGLPDPKALSPVHALLTYGAVALFVERARDTQPEFQLTTATAPASAPHHLYSPPAIMLDQHRPIA